MTVGLAFQERAEGLAVQVGRGGEAGVVEEGGREIEQGRRQVALVPRADAGVGCQEGNSGGSLVGERLATAGVVAERLAVVA